MLPSHGHDDRTGRPRTQPTAAPHAPAGGIAMNGATGRGHPRVVKHLPEGYASQCSVLKRGREWPASASSALILRSRAFRAWLEPLIPSLRRARRDTGFPVAVSLLVIRHAWLISAVVGVLSAVPWTPFGDRSGPG